MKKSKLQSYNRVDELTVKRPKLCMSCITLSICVFVVESHENYRLYHHSIRSFVVESYKKLQGCIAKEPVVNN